MDSSTGDEVYGHWINNWRKWKFAWCQDTKDPVITFYVRFICKNGEYTEDEYADLADNIGTSIGKTHIDRDGRINIHSRNIGSIVSIEIVKNNKGGYVDRFGIVTFKLNMFLRKYILDLCKILECMEYGVIHNNGVIVSAEYDTTSNLNPSKLPMRDDPVWKY